MEYFVSELVKLMQNLFSGSLTLSLIFKKYSCHFQNVLMNYYKHQKILQFEQIFMLILIKSVTSGILFSISVTFELKLVQVTKPVILGFSFSISVIFVLSVALVNK